MEAIYGDRSKSLGTSFVSLNTQFWVTRLYLSPIGLNFGANKCGRIWVGCLRFWGVTEIWEYQNYIVSFSLQLVTKDPRPLILIWCWVLRLTPQNQRSITLSLTLSTIKSLNHQELMLWISGNAHLSSQSTLWILGTEPPSTNLPKLAFYCKVLDSLFVSLCSSNFSSTLGIFQTFSVTGNFSLADFE